MSAPPDLPRATRVERAVGRGGLPCLHLHHASGSAATVHLHGAHVTSFADPSGDELLFVSERARFAAGEAIRGGIPVIFPQFGAGPLPKHGFARTAEWALVDAGVADDGRSMAVLALRSDHRTRAVWPFDFEARLTVSLGEHLTVELRVENRGPAPLYFTCALHSYLRVGDVRGVALLGLGGCSYRDSLAGGVEARQHDAALYPRDALDRVYRGAPRVLRLEDPSGPRAIVLTADGFADAVVWNPGAAGARALPNLGEAEARRMLCVEPAHAIAPVHLEPGRWWVGRQTIARASLG